jgi:hypothetical protein
VQQRTFDTYNDIDCFHYSGLHDAIKRRKHGYGKVTDHACRELRLKRLTREQAQQLVSRYDAIAPSDTPLFLRWAGMDEQSLWSAVDRHRNARAWRYEARNPVRVELEEPSASAVEAGRLAATEPCEFRLTPSKAPHRADDRYVLVGKGYVDPSELAFAG